MDDLLPLRPVLNERYLWQPMPDGCLLYAEGSGDVLTLNPAAELILTYCDGHSTLGDIAKLVAADIGMERDDFIRTASQLLKEKVLLAVTGTTLNSQAS